MNKIPYKVRMGIGVGLVLLSIIGIVAAIICGASKAPIWLLILLIIIAALSFVIGVIFVPRTNGDRTPSVIETKSKINKPKRYKNKKVKKSFMTDKEWKEEEEEDDEMFFIDEVVEDD